LIIDDLIKLFIILAVPKLNMMKEIIRIFIGLRKIERTGESLNSYGIRSFLL